MGGHPSPGCWSCGEVPSEEDILLDSVLHPRAAGKGGPWTGMACRSCGVEGVLEGVPGCPPLLVPPEAAGLETSAVATLLDGRRARDLRRRARAWMERWAAALERLRAARRAGPSPAEGPRSPPPPPRGGRRPSGGRVPPAPRRPSLDLPRTPEEARGILGVGPGASRKEIDSAYRKASRRCHPDLVAHLDEDFQRLAHEKFLRLKRAQEILRGRS